MTKKKTTKPKEPEIIGPDGKAFRKSAAWVRPEHLILHFVGAPKIGKSSTANALGSIGVNGINPFVLPLQPGLEGLDVNCPVVDCPYCKGKAKGCSECKESPGPGRVRKILTSYKEIEKWIDWLLTEEFNPIVFDPTVPLIEACTRRAEEVIGETVENAKRIGVVWWRAKEILEKLLAKIINAGLGMIFISHLQWRDIIVGKNVITKAETNLGQSKMAGFIHAIVDVEMQFDVTSDGKMIARIKPGQANIGGDRTGYLPDILDRGNSPEEAARNFLSCFYKLD